MRESPLAAIKRQTALLLKKIKAARWGGLFVGASAALTPAR
jgi:hypothetical protein